MGISVSIKGLSQELVLNDYKIINYKFSYQNKSSRYAKANDNDICLELTGNIMKIAQDNYKDMELIRQWMKEEYADDDFYKRIKLVDFYGSKTIRNIILSKAFVKDYYEKIDSHSSMGLFVMKLVQKEDQLEGIKVFT